MTADELQQLASPLIAIGSRRTRMTMANSEATSYELAGSKQKLERLLGREVTQFCFPFGAYNEETVRWCWDAGYRRVFMCDPKVAFSQPGESVVGRVAIEPTDWPLEFHLKLVGAYSWLPVAFALKRSLTRRIRGGKQSAKLQARTGSRPGFAVQRSDPWKSD